MKTLHAYEVFTAECAKPRDIDDYSELLRFATIAETMRASPWWAIAPDSSRVWRGEVRTSRQGLRHNCNSASGVIGVAR